MEKFMVVRRWIRDVLGVLLLLSIITAIWAWSYKTFASTMPIPQLDKGSFFTALFGAASTALFVLSAVILILTVAGWQYYLESSSPENQGRNNFFRASILIKKWLYDILVIVLLLSVITEIWSFSYLVFAEAATLPIDEQLNQESLFTVLFGASSIALFILSLLVAILAIFGWQSVKGHVEKRVDDRVKEQKKVIEEATEVKTYALENELRGRAATILGFALGEMSLKPGSFVAGDKDRLEQAVKQCEAGYKYLEKVGGPAEALALNNLVFYSCVYAEGSPKENTEFMLKKARLLRDLGQKHNSTMLKLTACRVLLEYEAEPQEKVNARETLRAITSSSSASLREKKEAGFYLRNYPELGRAPRPRA